MGLLDYIPVVSTIKHAFFDDPPGRTVADYADCATRSPIVNRWARTLP